MAGWDVVNEAVAEDGDGLRDCVYARKLGPEAYIIRAFEKARAAHGQERLTVNCAGIATGMKTVSRKKDTGEIRAHDMAQFERTVRVNLFGTFNTIHAWLPALRSPAGAAARDYLKSRAINSDIAKNWHLGYAPDSRDALLNDLVRVAAETAATQAELAVIERQYATARARMPVL